MKSRQREFLKRYGVLRTWKTASWRLITDITEWNSQVEFLRAHGTEAKTKRAESDEWYKPYTYKIDKEYKKYHYHLFFNNGKGLEVWAINYIQPTKKPGQGRAANRIEKNIFERINGVTERKAFGYCDRELIYKCIPKQLYYIDESAKNLNISHVSKADFSSHYPACMTGKIPTWAGHIEKPGTVKPSKEYPFAFYVKSGHVAEYRGVDTHKWLESPLWLQLFGENYSPEVDAGDDLTILCKSSKYTYDATIAEIYAKKNAGEDIDGLPSKIVLNAAIGFKHLSNRKNKQNRLDHIAAITLARANDKMLKLFYRGKTLMIVVDSIIYRGRESVGIKEKKLGKLHQEIVDADFRMRGTNQYAFYKDGEIINFCHGGFDKNISCERLEDIDKWEKFDIIKLKD